jgi:hypothetical protein
VKARAATALALLVLAGGGLHLAWTGAIPGGRLLRDLLEDPSHRAWREHREARAARRKAFREEVLPQSPVVFLGSSTIARWPLAQSFPGEAVLNRGIGAELLLEIQERVHELPEGTRGLVLYAGSRELRTTDQDPVAIAGAIGDLVRLLRARWPGIPIVLLGVLPDRRMDPPARARLEELNRLLELGAPHFGVRFLPTDRAPFRDAKGRLEAALATDDFHLNGDGYAALARLLVAEAGQGLGLSGPR